MKRLFLSILLLACSVGLFAVSPSGTLPVMYITTKNQQEVNRDYAIEATLYVTGSGNYAALGSPNSQIPLTIKGRGNWTWNGFDKKPYKIVFAAGHGQKLLGMHKSKHWALMAGADDYLGFLKNTVGYSLSEHIGLPYTPHQVPVELVLNGDYKGLYFVTETVRIDNDRVNIHEQNDGETASELITGGWLVEIDNYPSDGNITFEEHNGQYVMVTPQSPEKLSAVQRTYITNQLNQLNDAIYAIGAQHLGALLDLNDAARYYLVQEIMEDTESYHGSCFLYKDRDTVNTGGQWVVPKWHFGPVWDFGNAYDRHQERFIYDGPTFSQIWIEQLCRNEVFYERVQQLWYQYRHSSHSKVLDDINAFVSAIASAAKRDAERWKDSDNVRKNADMQSRKQEFLSRMNWRLDWLYSQWGEGNSTPLPDDNTQAAIAETNVNNSRSQILIRNGQILVSRNGILYNITGVPVE